MKKPSEVASKTNITPKWLHKCRGLFMPRTLSLFAGATTAAISGFLLIGPAGHTDLINDLLNKNDTQVTHLTSDLKEIEPAPAMLITNEGNNGGPLNTGQTDPAKRSDCSTDQTAYKQAYEAERRRHLEQLNDRKTNIDAVEENQRHEAMMKQLHSQSSSSCKD